MFLLFSTYYLLISTYSPFSKQDELLQLKGLDPGLRLRRTNAGPRKPFPVTASSVIKAPEDAWHIDVDSIELQAVIDVKTGCNEEGPPSLIVLWHVVSQQLPITLSDAITERIQQFHESTKSPLVLNIGACFDFARSKWTELICCVPEAIERYEAVDVAGRTIRRIAVVSVTKTNTPGPEPREKKSSDDDLAAELRFIKRRFPLSKIDCLDILACRSTEDMNERLVVFQVNVVPTDPEWVPKGLILTLECTILPETFSLTLNNPLEVGMSDRQCEIFNHILDEKISALHGQYQALRKILRECENKAGQMRLQAAEIESEEKQRRDVRFPHWMKDQEEMALLNSDVSDPELSSESDTSGDSNGTKEGVKQDKGTESEQHIPKNAVNMSLRDLQLVEVDVLDIVSIALSVRCARCSSLEELTCLPSTNSKRQVHADMDCGICHRPLSVLIQPHFVYERSNLLATILESNCLPQDFLPSTFSGQCGNCSNLAAFRNVQPGRWNERTCGHCHRRLAFYFSSVRFTRDQTVEKRSYNVAQEVREKKHRAGKSDGLMLPQPGHPLPSKGTCHHYKHSYRWLRFPCCGRRFPCDLCHEEGTDDGHEMKWAHRMVCGFCSLEQSVDQRCKECGRRLTSNAAQPNGKATNFWEGGKGQRDQKFLSRKDPHKWSSSKNKTHSRKEFRVGAKGKERLLAKNTS